MLGNVNILPTIKPMKRLGGPYESHDQTFRLCGGLS